MQVIVPASCHYCFPDTKWKVRGYNMGGSHLQHGRFSSTMWKAPKCNMRSSHIQYWKSRRMVEQSLGFNASMSYEVQKTATYGIVAVNRAMQL